jgi:GT2 family glycosyltransferase
MTKLPKVSIIIVNYQGWQETVECLKSLEKLNYDNFKVFVVDNHSPNGSFKKINSFLKKFFITHPRFKVDLIASHKNLGFAGGNNLGIKKAQAWESQYFLLLNPDTRVTPNFLNILVDVAQKPNRFPHLKKYFDEGKRVGFLGPRIFYTDKKTVYSNGGIINKTLTQAILKDHGRKRHQLIKQQDPFITDYITGTALFFSQEILKDIGLMQENYFLYYEDSDWAVKASQKGYFHLLVPNAVIYHKGYHSTKHLSFQYIYYLTRNGYYLAWNNGKLAHKIFVIFLSICKFLKQPLKWFIYLSKRKWIKPILKATWDFWRGKKGKLS